MNPHDRLLVGLLVGLSVTISYKGGKLHFKAPIYLLPRLILSPPPPPAYTYCQNMVISFSQPFPYSKYP